MKKSFLCLVIAGTLIAVVPLAAHHSISAEFDTNKPIKFTGTVKKVEWLNPHIYTQVEVKEAGGKVIVYKVEGGPPNSLYRNGWRPDSLKPGETVNVSGIRAKSETSRNVGVATILKSDGTPVFGGRGGN